MEHGRYNGMNLWWGVNCDFGEGGNDVPRNLTEEGTIIKLSKHHH